MEFGKVIRRIREENGWTLEEMAKRLGTTKQAISKYERGERTPKVTVAARFAETLGISLAEITGVSESEGFLPDGVVPISRLSRHRIPLVGSVAAGEPILADESVDLYIDGPAKADYALRVQGDSMNPVYLDGDVVYIRQVPDVPDGTVGVALIDDSACLKHIYHIPNGLLLTSDNPAYPPMQKTWPECDTIRILGVVVGYTRIYKEGRA